MGGPLRPRFDGYLRDPDEVVERIVGALAVTLTQGEQQRLRRHGTSNVEAYERWLRARDCSLAALGSRSSKLERCIAKRSSSI